MRVQFHKYQGAGNDFIVINDREKQFPANDKALVTRLCDRRFGIGSDGILLIQPSEEADLHVDFINPDGSRSFCGNGSRCAIRFAASIGLIGNSCSFTASDGLHQACLTSESVQIAMRPVTKIEEQAGGMELYTGSPHLIRFVEGLSDIDVAHEGAEIRYSPSYKDHGINVNFVEVLGAESLAIRTYERGVEAETLACGTGVTAAALAHAQRSGMDQGKIAVKALGGNLEVSFERSPEGYHKVMLIGPAEAVYVGHVEL